MIRMVGAKYTDTGRWGPVTPPAICSSASSRVLTPTSWMPSTSSGTLRAGRMQRVKPICAASRTRRAACPELRTSPPRPTSPKTTVRGGRGRLRNDEATAAATPRSAAGSATSRPPATLTNTSSPRSCSPTRFSSTAMQQRGAVGVEADGHAARVAERRRARPGPGSPRAWDASPRRWPPPPSPASRPAARTGTARTGWGPACRPVPVISKTPSSEIAPKRFFTARTMRWCWCFSPSK